MYPRLRNDVSISIVTDKKSSEKRYVVENRRKEQFIVSYRLCKELLHADGTHPLRISKACLERLKKDNILTTSRYVFDGFISQFVLLPLGKGIGRFRPVCRLVNAALPCFTILLLAVSIFLKQKYCHFSTGEPNLLLFYLLIFLSMAVHECAHLIAGISCGYRFSELGLLLLGIFPVGAYVSGLEKRNVRPLAHVQFCLAGIEANLCIGAVFLLLSIIRSPLDMTFVTAANVNMVLAALNLLPAAGLDGEAALSTLLGVERLSEYTKLFLKNKKFRKRILHGGAPGYVCAAIFVINLILSVFVGILMICDVIAVLVYIFR